MTERSLYSPNWYRVAELRPRIRNHAGIHRQHYRGQVWYVLQDRTSGRFHRFTPAAHLVISLMDGKRTVQEVWDESCIQLGEDVLTQDEMIRVLSQLHAADVLYGDVPPDLDEVSERGTKQRRRKLVQSVMNPLAVRIPLFDPDEFLSAIMPLIRPVFSWIGALVFAVTIGYALVLTGMHWGELTENIVDRVLATESILLLLLTYPFVKAIHELGHGFAVKHWGGEVHEIGVMFLVFMPVPYVDASAASVYQNKWHRALVGAAGILVEALLASIALFVWLNAEEGLARAFAFNVMLIGGVSTVMFNGNPLLRFDGYYVLSDILEIPNLGVRANRYIGHLIQRHLFGIEDSETPVTGKREAPWLFLYSIASFCYRIFILTVIVAFVATKFFVVGVLIAAWAVILMFGVPLAKQIWFLLTSPMLRRRRGRAFAVTAGFAAAAAVWLMMVPLPYATIAQGVVWTSGETVVHASADGTVVKVLAAPNSRVAAGDALVQMEDPLLDTRVMLLRARVRELELRYSDRDVANRVEAKIVAEQLRHARADLALARQRQEDLVVRSSADGTLMLPDAPDLPGRFIRKGDVLGYAANLSAPVVRVIVSEDDADLVRQRVTRVEIRLVQDLFESVEAEIVREIPGLSATLPSLALSTVGGGEIAIDPTDPEQMKVLGNLLHLELRPNAPIDVTYLGSRVYVKFSHGSEPLMYRLYRMARQVFLRQFNV